MDNSFKQDANRNGFFSTIIQKLSNFENFMRDHRSISHGIFSNVIGAHGANLTIPASTTYYMTPYTPGLQTTPINSIYPISGMMNKIGLRIGNSQPASGSLVVTLVINGVDSSLVLTIPAGSPFGTYTEITTSVSYTAFDPIRWKIVNNATSASAQIGSLVTAITGMGK